MESFKPTWLNENLKESNLRVPKHERLIDEMMNDTAHVQYANLNQQVTPSGQQSAVQQNQINRQLVLKAGVDSWQNIFSQSFTAAAITGPVNVLLRNVGLIKGLLVKVQGTITTGTDAGGVNLTPFGAANILSTISLTDYNNTIRINDAGWHISLINSAKQPLVFGGAYAPNVPVGYGNNWTVMSAPATIAASTDQTVQFYYYIPCAYGPQDLTGAIFAQNFNSQATLALTLNPAPIVADNADPTLAVYQTLAHAGTLGGWKALANDIKINVWQNYVDKLPKYSDFGQPVPQNSPYGPYILPMLDLSILYQLVNTSLGNLVAGQNNNIPYANYDTFLSTSVIFDNNGTLNVGSDVSLWTLLASNTTQIFSYGPQEAALFARSTFFADPPKGCYYFSHRNAPIQTLNFGNINLVLNPIVGQLNAGASLLVGFEYLTQASQVQFASALPTPTGG